MKICSLLQSSQPLIKKFRHAPGVVALPVADLEVFHRLQTQLIPDTPYTH